MKVKMILPALTEAKHPYFRPIKYSLFPPLGLATLAGYLDTEDEVEIVDEHVEDLNLNDTPDLVVIETYITSARRAYRIALSQQRKLHCHGRPACHITSDRIPSVCGYYFSGTRRGYMAYVFKGF